jgi:general nucleoside transport system ATP-binding protein
MSVSRAEGLAVSMRGIRKCFGETVANDDVDFDLHKSEIHALLGENGAGKTTLMRILFGLARPDEGAISIAGSPVDFSSPRDALDHRIGMVHQHFMLVPGFTVAENVVLGSRIGRGPTLRHSEIERIVAETAEQFGIHVDPRAPIDDLPVETKQRVEILKLLYRGADTLILDEPTSVLGPVQIEALLSTLDGLRGLGTSIVIVTHKLSEVTGLADRVTVLRHGRNVVTAERRVGAFDEGRLAAAMIGRDVERLPGRRPQPHETGEADALLRVEGLTVQAVTGGRALDGLAFRLGKGEILGIAGVAGNGQSELVYSLAGILEAEEGSIELEGQDLTHATVGERKAAGLGVIPDDRERWGLALDMTIAENLAMARVVAGEFRSKGMLRLGRSTSEFRKLLEAYDVRPPNPQLRAGALSGGNQQKVVLARELDRHPRVLVAASPTQGLDVGAASFVLSKLVELRNAGGSVLLISTDLDQLTTVADRVIVLYRGRIAYHAYARHADTDALARAMAGGVAGSEPEQAEETE